MHHKLPSARLSRRSLLRAAGIGTGAALFPSMSLLSRAQAAATIEEAVEWARKNLPSSTPDIVNAAAKEGKLKLTLINLGGNEEAVRGIIKAFNERYPFIAATYTMHPTVQLLNTINAEVTARKGVSDYFNMPSNLKTVAGFENQGAIQNFVISSDQAFPANGKKSGVWYAWRGEQPTTLYRAGAVTDEEKKLLRTFEGLADPRFKGRLGLNSVSNTVSVACSFGLMFGSNPKLWEGLAANKPKVKPTSESLVGGCLAGEYDIGIMCGNASPTNAAKQGAPLEYGTSTPSPTLYTPGAISAFAPNPNAAKLWQDWFMSVEGQDVWSKVSGGGSVRTDVHEKSWAEQQPWFFRGPGAETPFDWTLFAEKEAEVIARFKKDMQAG